MIKKTKTRPWAVDGGHEPDASQVSVFPGTGREHQVSTKRVAVARGDRITLITAGGGHGDPALRDPEAVQRDVGDDYVPATAPNYYGVEAHSAAQ